MRKKIVSVMLATVLTVSMVSGCGNINNGGAQAGQEEDLEESTDSVTESNEESADDGGDAAEGSITLTMAFHNTEEWYEENMIPVVEEFKQMHPEVKDIVYTTLSGMGDEQQVTRLTGGQYEDIVLVPTILLASEWGNYFAPLGDASEMAEKYYYGDYMQYEGQSYGIPIGVVYEGLLYNKKVLDQYCDGNIPKTLDELMDDCAKLKENGVIGFYTNAGSIWTMRYWDNLAITMSDDPDYANKIIDAQEPWAEGSSLRDSADILAQLASNGYLEPDVVTADQWDVSLTSLGSGQTAFMFTGTWALSQAQEHAVAAGFSADDIGFAPFPYKNDVSADNKLNLRVAQDVFLGVNKNSENLELAKEFCAFFCERVSLAMGMNEIMIDGGKNQPDLEFLQELDYVQTYTSPARDSKISEMAGIAGIDVYNFDGFLLDYVILPVLNGKEPEYDKLNEAWKKNF